MGDNERNDSEQSRSDHHHDPQLYRQIGELDGRVTAVERDVNSMFALLRHIEGGVNTVRRSLAWLWGGIGVVVTLAGAAGWYMAQGNIPPLDAGAPENVQEQRPAPGHEHQDNRGD